MYTCTHMCVDIYTCGQNKCGNLWANVATCGNMWQPMTIVVNIQYHTLSIYQYVCIYTLYDYSSKLCVTSRLSWATSVRSCRPC